MIPFRVFVSKNGAFAGEPNVDAFVTNLQTAKELILVGMRPLIVASLTGIPQALLDHLWCHYYGSLTKGPIPYDVTVLFRTRLSIVEVSRLVVILSKLNKIGVKQDCYMLLCAYKFYRSTSSFADKERQLLTPQYANLVFGSFRSGTVVLRRCSRCQSSYATLSNEPVTLNRCPVCDSEWLARGKFCQPVDQQSVQQLLD